jgi:hypothetical protein
VNKWHICWLIMVILTLVPGTWMPPARAFPPLTNVNAAVNLFTYRVTFNVFDPSRSQTISGSEEGVSPVTSFVHQDGIVAWVRQQSDASQDLWYTTYDPGPGLWKTETRHYPALDGSPALDNLQIGDGVLVWRIKNSGGYQINFASYDPSFIAWKIGVTNSYLTSAGIKVEQGLVACYRSPTEVVFNVYDPFHGWQEGVYSDPHLINFFIQNFTVWVGIYSEIMGTYYISIGYNGSWAANTVTKSYAWSVLYPWYTAYPAHPPIRTMRFWLTDMSIGATSWSYIFDDGLITVGAREFYRIYTKPGMHYVRQEISGPFGNGETYNFVFSAETPMLGFLPLLLMD